MTPQPPDRRDATSRALHIRTVRNPGPVNIRTGAVLELREGDHLGAGSLALKVGPVDPHLRQLPSALEWVVLVGRVVHPDGLGQPRKVCVRVSAIPGAMRPDNWRPTINPRIEPLAKRAPGSTEETSLAQQPAQVKTPGPADSPGRDCRPDRG